MQDKLVETPTRPEGALHQEIRVKKSGAGRKVFWLIVLAAVAGGGWYYYQHRSQPAAGAAQQAGGRGGRGRGGAGGGGPVPVVVSTAMQQDLPIYLDGLGSVVAQNTVMVNSRVDGELTEVEFKEGQMVRKGELLAVIDPRPYQVALASAQAALSRDTAMMQDAKLNAQRYGQLAKEGVVAQQQSDTLQAQSEQLAAAVAADQAAIDSAKLNINYSHITAPIDGRVGLRLMDPGNIVRAAAQTTTNGLLLITQMQPITLVFTLPEDSLPSVLNGMRRGALTVKAMSRDNGTELETGTLLTVDNTIDQATGTFKLKALFKNGEEKLWPNQFVNARLLLNTEKNALIIPVAAIQDGGQGPFVYAVKADKTAEVRPVTVSVREGSVAAISKGISPGDQVVVDGMERLRAGMAVDAHPAEQRGAGGARTADAGQGGGPNQSQGVRGGQGGPGGPGGQRAGGGGSGGQQRAGGGGGNAGNGGNGGNAGGQGYRGANGGGGGGQGYRGGNGGGQGNRGGAAGDRPATQQGLKEGSDSQFPKRKS